MQNEFLKLFLFQVKNSESLWVETAISGDPERAESKAMALLSALFYPPNLEFRENLEIRDLARNCRKLWGRAKRPGEPRAVRTSTVG